MRRVLSCRSTFGCPSPVARTTRSLVPEHVLLFVADKPVGVGSDAGQLRYVRSARVDPSRVSVFGFRGSELWALCCCRAYCAFMRLVHASSPAQHRHANVRFGDDGI